MSKHKYGHGSSSRTWLLEQRDPRAISNQHYILISTMHCQKERPSRRRGMNRHIRSLKARRNSHIRQCTYHWSDFSYCKDVAASHTRGFMIKCKTQKEKHSHIKMELSLNKIQGGHFWIPSKCGSDSGGDKKRRPKIALSWGCWFLFFWKFAKNPSPFYFANLFCCSLTSYSKNTLFPPRFHRQYLLSTPRYELWKTCYF